MTGNCRLCGQECELRISHIVPKFVWRWLKATSPTGHLRDSRTPNRRLQDGWTDRLLCDSCEQLLSQEEKPFAENIFVPLHQNAEQPFGYGTWALRFAVSVVWRSLVFGGDAQLNHLSPEQLAEAHKAERVWREFLLGSRPHPGIHRVHLVPLDIIASHTTPGLSPFLNRYLVRGVDVDVVHGRRDVFIYAKLCRVLLIGMVDVARPSEWSGGQLNLKSGVVGGPVQYVVPAKLYDYMNSRAELNAASLRNMSAVQKAKIEAAMMDNIDALASSELFRAMSADVTHSGGRAFRITETSDSK